MLDAHSSQKRKRWTGEQQDFTCTEKVSYKGLVDFVWNVCKGEASECLFGHSFAETSDATHQ